GRYAIQASPGQRTYKGVTTETPAGRLLITVTDAGLDDLVLHLAPALELHGRTIERAAPPTVLSEPCPCVTLYTTEGGLTNSPWTQSRDDGTFHVQRIMPGSYRVEVGGVFPPG